MRALPVLWSPLVPGLSLLVEQLPDRINLSMGYSGVSSHVSLWFSCRGNPLPARRIKQMIKCLACLVLKYVSSGFVSSNVNDRFPLSTVSSVCEVQMQLGYEQERMMITSPKENSTG